MIFVQHTAHKNFTITRTQKPMPTETIIPSHIAHTHTHTQHDLYVPTDQTFYGHINVAVSLLQGPNIRALVVKSHIPQRLELNRVAFGGALVATTPSLYIYLPAHGLLFAFCPDALFTTCENACQLPSKGVTSVG